MAESIKPTNSGERVLRIGVIQGVRVIEERILRKREPITFGTADSNTFALAASDLPRSVTVFQPHGEGYELVLDDQMQGRLEGPDGKKDFAGLRASATKKDGSFKIPLADTSKGRVRLSNEITVLFHFVVAPAVAAAPEMPSEVRGGFLRSIEPVFMAVLTASFLVHFAFGIFIKVTAPPAPPTLDDLRELVERIAPPKVEVKIPPPKVADTGTATTAAPVEEVKGSGGDGSDKPSGDGGKPKGKGGGGAGDRAAIREGIAGKGILQLIGGRSGGDGSGIGSVFGSSGGISDDIGGALAGTAGVGIAGAGGGDGVTRRGTGGGGGGGDGGEGGGAVGIGDLKTEGGGKVDTGAKTATRVVARVKADDVETVDGKIDKKSVAATIRRRQDGFQACYETALKSNSKLGGKIVVEFTIGGDGKVTEARVVKDGLNSGEVNNCVLGLLKRLRFPTPADGGEVTISNTFVFQPGG
ncbi:MAG: AgmX/PglI C-terminal domain-containing protein [Deltaproteobacteria bacterium]|nr:AgmX/PglI C-terminal domain-containing protein [Deltaproteobacteria bacterium]